MATSQTVSEEVQGIPRRPSGTDIFSGGKTAFFPKKIKIKSLLFVISDW